MVSEGGERAGPITSAERISYIDILRGTALLGILAGNMRGFNAPNFLYSNIDLLFHSRADLITQRFIDIFLQGKFVTIFSFLFGLGFAMQMTRAQARGAKFMSFYPRRLAALALFGLIHGILIWWGDILLSYALAGSLLLLFRERDQRTLLWYAGAIFSLPVLAATAVYAAALASGKSAVYPLPDMARIQAVIQIYAHGSVGQILHQNWVEWLGELPTVSFAGYGLFLFLLGLYVWRTGLVERLDEHQRLMRRVCAWCLPIGTAMSAYAALNLHSNTGRPSFRAFLAGAIYYPGAHIMAAGYASGLAILLHKPAWKRRLTPFAAVGRMGLTTYLSQSLVCTWFYYSTGLYGRVGPAMGLIPTFVLFAGQIAFSNWWMGRYRFGPMEWLWRGMTYGEFPEMKRREPIRQAAVIL